MEDVEIAVAGYFSTNILTIVKLVISYQSSHNASETISL